MEDVTVKELTVLADKLLGLREEKSSLDAEITEVKKEIRKIEEYLFDKMIDEEIDGLETSGYSFSPKITQEASVLPELIEKAMRALVAKGHGGLIKRTVNPQTFRSFYRESLDTSGLPPKWLKKYVRVFDRQSISIRKKV